MKINFTGKHLDITPSLKQLTEDKLQRLEKHFSPINQVDITFEVEKQLQIVRGTLHLTGGPINASADSDDMYKSIDLLINKLDSLLIKHKDKIQNH